MASKYEAVFQRLEKILNTEPKHQEKIDAVKKAMREEPSFELHASSLAAEYTNVRREKDGIEKTLSDCQVRLDAVFQMMCEQFEVEGTKAITLENGDNVRIQPKIYASVVDAEVFRLWCLEQGLERQMTLHPQTAKSLINQRLFEGDPEPPGTKASVVDSAVFTKG
jgi:hypothetical protein